MLRLDAPRTRLHSGAPWWLVRDGLGGSTPKVPSRADVAIVGAGITGALIADALSAEGIRVVAVDRRMPASGSTAASTALLQYELDTGLAELSTRIGDRDAVRAYRLSHDAVHRLERICETLPDRCGFAHRTSLYLASTPEDTGQLLDEAAARDRAGFEAEFLGDAEVRARYDLPSHGALRTSIAGVVDPVRLTRELLSRAGGRGAHVASWTTAVGVSKSGDGLVVHTTRGTINVDRLVLACGYEVPPCLEPAVTELHGTYALVTEPVEDFGRLGAEVIVWESSRPYTYLRTVEDRWVVGGMDIADRGDMHRDMEMASRTRCLEAELRRLRPGTDVATAFSWAGTFGVTDDGLPVIGNVPGMDRVHYALGYGGNGITFGVVAADILRDFCLGRPNDDARIFRPDR